VKVKSVGREKKLTVILMSTEKGNQFAAVKKSHDKKCRQLKSPILDGDIIYSRFYEIFEDVLFVESQRCNRLP
jgi:hypothetical protein